MTKAAQPSHSPLEHLVRTRVDKFRLELPRIVAAILAEVPGERLRQLVRELAMEPSPVLPKRLERPQALVAYSVSVLGRTLGLSEDRLEELLKMTVAFVEAGDIYDDAVDGDFAEGHLHHLLAVSSCLHFVATRSALRLGPEVADGWLVAMHELPAALVLEKDGDGSLATYLEAVRCQGTLFGAIGRAAARAAGSSEAEAAAAEELLRLLYTYLQYPQDLREAPTEVAAEGLAANIMRHMSVDQLALLFAQVHAEMTAALARLPATRARNLLADLIEAIRPLR